MDVVNGTYSLVRDWFWTKSFWLPAYSTWEELEVQTPDLYYPNARDLWIPFPLAVILFLVRLTWERCVAQPIGQSFKLREAPPKPAAPNELLERAFKKHRKVLPSHNIVQGYCKQLDWSERAVERWWRARRAQCKPSELQRFKETSWRFLFYFVSFWGGVYTLWDKSWFKDTKHCWYGYPKQHVTADIWWYYMLELSFYWSLVLSLFMDTRRKDFTEMIVHHISTITLMSMSWSANMVRVGTLVLCVHDAVDYIMEFGKLTKYCKYHRFADAVFVLFTIVWLLTRLTIYPFWILRSTLFEATTIVGMAPIYYAYNGLLCILQVLHIFWFYIILRMAYSYIVKGSLEKDARSDTEIESGEEEEQEKDVKRNNSARLNDGHVNQNHSTNQKRAH
jgi:hypothetical protein